MSSSAELVGGQQVFNEEKNVLPNLVLLNNKWLVGSWAVAVGPRDLREVRAGWLSGDGAVVGGANLHLVDDISLGIVGGVGRMDDKIVLRMSYIYHEMLEIEVDDPDRVDDGYDLNNDNAFEEDIDVLYFDGLYDNGKYALAVYNGTVLKDLTGRAGLGGGGGSEGGVRLEEAPPLEKELVVAEVEGAEAAGVHLDDGGVVVRHLALAGLEVGGVLTVEGRVFVPFPREVV
ncbi:hypothetical protein V2J09_009076 [Rumex salicifolius]